MEEAVPILAVSALFVWALSRAIARIIFAAKSGADSALRTQVDDVEAELEEIRERVEVLEKIITDQNYQLDNEFRNLAG